MDLRAEQVASAIRSQLRERVSAPGLRAIKAVLLMADDSSLTQADVLGPCKTSKDSIRKYRELMGKLDVDFTSGERPEALEIPLAQPAAQLSPLLTPAWLAEHAPQVSELRVVAEYTDGDGTWRELHANVADAAGGVQPATTRVRHAYAPPTELPEARRTRQRYNWDAEARAVRDLDMVATEERLERRRKHEAAEREAEAQRQHALQAHVQATPVPAGDPAWTRPPHSRPRFVGECVWVIDDQRSARPALGMVVTVWANGDCDVRSLCAMAQAVPIPSSALPA